MTSQEGGFLFMCILVALPFVVMWLRLGFQEPLPHLPPPPAPPRPR